MSYLMRNPVGYVSVSVFLIIFSSNFILPYLSLEILTDYTHQNLFLSVLVFSMPLIAQVSTLQWFNNLAARTNRIKVLLLFGYSAMIIQFIGIYLVVRFISDALLVVIISFITNLLAIVYLPSVKAWLTHTSTFSAGKSLSQINLLLSIAQGFGLLCGGWAYTWLSIESLLMIAIACDISALLLVVFVPPLNLIEKTSTSLPSPSIIPSQSRFSGDQSQDKYYIPIFNRFQSALIFHFILRICVSIFIAIFPLYLASIQVLPYFYGSIFAAEMGLSVGVYPVFGRLLDKRGPNFLYWYGIGAYLIVYVGLLLTQNLVAIFILWSTPAYIFDMVLEFYAARISDPIKIVHRMTQANFVIILGTTLGQLLGGAITTWLGGFRVAFISGVGGCIGMGIIYTFLTVRSRKKMQKEQSNKAIE